MSHVLASSVLSDEGVMTLLTAAIAAATEMGQPQCIVIVDQSGVTLGSFRMRGSRFQSLKSAAAKAQTAASIGAPSHSLPEHARVPLAVATHGGMTGLRGGLPIRLAGALVGGIGVGSGSGEQDEQVARVALKAIGADLD
ncbi:MULTISPECIES: heme-binding protein [unclassified Rhizobium]|uniref:heme-binding protein n=1 Tax=unclassified Rhizobium TaxID=2613769 RepID=UPI000EA95453|nr:MULTISPECIES: heme-binding protein [unclassified Rhizobium]AYG68806.1 heme-binding protein [Rhizobium sp. CCGE531]AYG75192.1 heme-binding protein [Rhizobium sp. CCGE532]